MKILAITEAITGLSGFAIIWWQTNGWIALAVALLTTSMNAKQEQNLWRK